MAAAVSRALAASGIEAVLTGGACAMIYTEGEYQSFDLDFILRSATTQRRLDAAMRTIGFARRADRYVLPGSPFFVEFLRGPLGIGTDIAIRPVERRIGGVRVRLLSPTDSCRDRLAAFYHWKDRQSLETALQIARRHKVDLRGIRRWSAVEGAPEHFEEFLAALRRRGGPGGPAGRRLRSRKPAGRK